MCVFFQKQKTSKLLLSPNQSVCCTVLVEEEPGEQRPKAKICSPKHLLTVDEEEEMKRWVVALLGWVAFC